MTLRIDAEDAGRGLGQLVVALLDIVRQLIERQAVRRVDAGGLTADQVERLGQALLELDERFAELRETFADGGTGTSPLPPVDLDDLLDRTNRLERTERT